MRYLEDFHVGETLQLGRFSLTAEAIVEFAQRYDPLPFHLEDDSANAYGGLIASGWQTGVECQKRLVEEVLNQSACHGSPGAEVRFLKPVRPDVEYELDLLVTEIQRSQSRSDRGIVSLTLTLRDPDKKPVYVLDGKLIILSAG